MIDNTGNERVSWIPFEWVAVFFFFVALGVTLGWMFDRDRQTTTISRLKRKIAKLEDGSFENTLVQSGVSAKTDPQPNVAVTEASHSSTFDQDAPAEDVSDDDPPVDTSNLARPESSQRDSISRTALIRRNVPKINIDEYMEAINSIDDVTELESLGFEASNLHGLVRPLLQSSLDPECAKTANATLRLITSPKYCSDEIVAELLDVVDVYRYSTDDKSAAICKAAFGCLVNVVPNHGMNLGKLDEIMNDDLSPWSAYACISLKLLEPQTDISRRFSDLLTSQFETNRLVVARKLLSYVRTNAAAELLADAKRIETSEKVMSAIDASLRQIDKRASKSSGTRKTF